MVVSANDGGAMRRQILLILLAVGALADTTIGVAQEIPGANAGTIGLYGGRVSLTLNTCGKSGSSIQCDFTFKSLQPAAVDYTYDRELSGSRLVDEAHISHPQSTGYFVIGDAKPSDRVTLVKDDTVKMIQIFSGSNQQIQKGNVLFGSNYFSVMIR